MTATMTPNVSTTSIAEPDLQNAMNRGIVQLEEHLFQFWDPGLSLSNLLALPVVQEGGLIEYCRIPLEQHAKWTMTERKPQERLLRTLVPGSRSCTRKEQEPLLLNKTHAGIAVVTTFLILDALSTGQTCYMHDSFVRCPECLLEGGFHTTVGREYDGPIRLDFAWSDRYYQELGIAVLEDQPE